MINEFGMRNFFCFKEGSTVSFRFDKNVPDEISRGKNVGTVLGIKGANGSGKTNIIKALSFISGFAYSSSDLDVKEKIEVDSYRNDGKPSEFYIDFVANEINYIYEFEVEEDAVISEVLWKKGERKSLVYRRSGSSIEKCKKEVNEIKRIQLKRNASVISMLKNLEFKSEMTDLRNVFNFFAFFLINVNYIGLSGAIMNALNYNEITKKYSEDAALFEFMKDVIVSSDIGIKDIIIVDRKNEKDETIYHPMFVHEDDEKDFLLTIYDESSGTQQLYKMMYLFWLTLRTGGVLALDEFDIHLHSLMLPKIIELFADENINELNAQFIFTAHNTEIIDSLGKYRTILVNKERNESYCYRVDELPGGLVRNDRKIAPLYVRGKIGGVPVL